MRIHSAKMATNISDDKSMPIHSHVEKVGHLHAMSDYERHQSVVADTNLEHELTFKDVLRNHKRLVWWCFYFAMCAIGW
jgi:hypothetical protein